MIIYQLELVSFASLIFSLILFLVIKDRLIKLLWNYAQLFLCYQLWINFDGFVMTDIFVIINELNTMEFNSYGDLLLCRGCYVLYIILINVVWFSYEFNKHEVTYRP